MKQTYRDPTADAVARLEEMPCGSCRWRDWNPFSRVAWCNHPRWTGREAQRPSTKPIGPLALRLHRCSDFEGKP
jgi:hypothetical protein